ncbi:hypothetical protein Ahy_A05g021693 isoform B [Arachis hypogaea]|uniref:Uncharacterized protein n=1 Tax=Arachis hypogaea TaxID=3818 RepID=A0A445CY32_ARAHY|nr:hypothetical protein Ahy_A05g021693 isoform B [Arachis hypogaea]
MSTLIGGRSRSTARSGRRSSSRQLRILIACLALLAILPPILFHLRVRRLHRIHLAKCAWLHQPPLVCAHGGDSSVAPSNTRMCLLLIPKWTALRSTSLVPLMASSLLFTTGICTASLPTLLLKLVTLPPTS